MDTLTRVRHRAGAPVDGASLAVFRIAFGLVVVWETYRYFRYGWIERYWIDPAYHFTYPGFGWVEPLPGDGMFVVWAAIGLSGLLIALGAWYRAATVTFAVLFTYQFLLEYARYLNHFYLMCLLGWLLAVVPAHRTWAVDSVLARRPDPTVPRWALWLVQLQIAVMYLGGAVAKVNADWIAGRPLGDWLAVHDDWPVVGPLLADPTTAVAFAWAGLALDLLVVPAVVWRRTRVPALVAIGLFHLLNARLFQIGVFPVLAMAATLVLLPPGWPRTAWAAVRRALGAPAPAPPLRLDAVAGPRPLAPWALALLGTFVAVQVLLPLRHVAIPGDVSWTEEGHDFAWHMKLRSKGGDVAFTVLDGATGAVWVPDVTAHLEPWQASKMAARPRMIADYARELGRQARSDRGFADPQVHANALVSLNGRDRAPLIDPAVDLLAVDDLSAAIMPHPDEQAAMTAGALSAP